MVVAGMETVVIVAIGVLATIFVASIVGLIVVCKHKYCKPIDLISRQLKQNNPNQTLVENMEVEEEAPRGADGVELDNVAITNWEQILENEAWVCDATGLAPHCLAILKTTHLLTDKLVGMTMGNSQQLRNPEALSDLVVIAKRIGPRVDDVVRAMYPPLDPRLLEARCTALVLSVSHLVLVTKNACCPSGNLDWIDQSLADVEDHLRVLHEASVAYEAIQHHHSLNSPQKEAAPSAPANEQHLPNNPSAPSQAPLPECIPSQDHTPAQNSQSSEV